MNDHGWLAELKVGDEVAIPVGYSRHLNILTIDRLTPAHIICDTRRFRRKDGRSVGTDGWNTAFLQPVTPDVRAHVRHRELVYRVSRTLWEKLPLPVLEQVAELIK